MKAFLLLASLSAALVGPARAAWAGDDPSRPEAVALYEDGLALADQAKVDHDAQKYELALRKFLAAYSLVHRPNVLFSVAVTERNLGRPADAVRDLRRFLRDPESEAKQVDLATKLMAELSPRVATLRISAPTGAEILVDGSSTGRTAPLADPIDLPPGRHTVEARLNDKTAEQTFDAPAGHTTSLDLAFLAPTSVTPPPEPEPSTPTPPPASPPAAPMPTAVFAPPPPPETSPSPAAAAPLSSARVIASVAMGVLGVAGIGTGIGFLLAASDADSRVRSLVNQQLVCPQPPTTASCQELADAQHARSDDTNLGRGLVAGGAVFLAGSIVTWLVWPSAAGRSISVIPVTTGKEAGAWVMGRF